METTRPRDVQCLEIATDTMIFRSRSWGRFRFEIEYALQRGTSANSYLIKGSKIALFDPPGESFRDIFLTALAEHLDLSTIDYIILGHINPNRAKTLEPLLDLATNATLICSNPAAISLQQLLPNLPETRIKVMRGEENLNLGNGHRLLFTPVPTPRWPGALATYDTKTQVLFTDKFFGAHVCGDQLFDEGWALYTEDRRYYFDCLMAPHARQVSTVLEKLSSLPPVRFYAPGHGPLVRYGQQELTHSYREWSAKQQQQEITVALVYASAYGNTAAIAQALASGMTKAGAQVESVNCEVTSPDEIKAILERSAGFVIGSPTLGGHAPTQVQTALGVVLSEVPNSKLAGVFGSFGWSGEAIDLLETKLRNAGFQFGFEPIRVKFTPTEAVMKACEEAGTDFVQALKKQEKAAKKAATPIQLATSTEQAIGRIVGSMCILTTQRNEVSSAMLASWVSQATFSPPGITVAVAKERAIESLLYKGNTFALNILGDGKHINLMKHFLKPFAPGEDRFAGVDWEPGSNGQPVLKEAIACLECTVKERMECGDHWLVYATTEAGTVFDADRVTAVHHRKTGTYY
ncbi:MAG: flavin oxidoreductase [Oscillatoriales cyanobacterium]|nr:MAG: flavin oxidoreductase [Oscillatoriales cyanobacterium]